MGKKKVLFIFSLAISLGILILPKPILAAEQPVAVLEMDDKSETIVLENGDAKVREVINMSTSAFIKFKQRYPLLSTFTRLFKPANMPVQIEDLKVNTDEAKNQIIVEYIMKGVSVNKGDHWEIDTLSSDPSQKVSLVAQNDNVLVFSLIGQATQEVKIVTTVTAKLPSAAQKIVFDSGANRIKYELPGSLTGDHPLFLILGLIFLGLGIFSFFLLKETGSPELKTTS